MSKAAAEQSDAPLRMSLIEDILGYNLRRAAGVGAIVAGTFVALVMANFGYLYPILTDELLPYLEELCKSNG